jgi:hypothetical protein
MGALPAQSRQEAIADPVHQQLGMMVAVATELTPAA